MKAIAKSILCYILIIASVLVISLPFLFKDSDIAKITRGRKLQASIKWDNQDFELDEPTYNVADEDLGCDGKDIIATAVQLLGKNYEWGAKGGDANNQGNAISADKVTGVDCSGLVWWTLKTLQQDGKEIGNIVIGQGSDSTIPIDTREWLMSKKHWFSDCYYFNRTYDSGTDTYSEWNKLQTDPYANEDSKTAYSGTKVNIVKSNDPITSSYRWYNYVNRNNNVDTLPAGTVVISAAELVKDSKSIDHAWIAIGDLGTTNKSDAVDKIKDLYGVDIKALYPETWDKYVQGDEDESWGSKTNTYWRIESSGKNGELGVRINNKDPDYLSTIEENGKIKGTGPIWAFQIGKDEVIENGSFSMNIKKIDRATGVALPGAIFHFEDRNTSPVTVDDNKVTGTDGIVELIPETTFNEEKSFTYSIMEKTPPDGYGSDVSRNFEIKINTEKVGKEYQVKNITIGGKEVTEQVINVGETYQYLTDGTWKQGAERDSQKTLFMVSAEGNANKAHLSLTWANPPTKGNFNIKLIKYKQGTSEKLDGASFLVKISKIENGQVATQPFYSSEKTTANGGQVSFSGIAIGGEGEKYQVTIEETQAPGGYIGISGPISFPVTTVLDEATNTYKLVADGDIKGKTGDGYEVSNAKKVEVKENEILIEAENTTTGIDIHKGVKTVENQDSGYYSNLKEINVIENNDTIVNKQQIWNFLVDVGCTEQGAAAIMGVLEIESNCKSVFVQGIFDNADEYSSKYTKDVDEGTISETDFCNDGKRYGIASWTSVTYKEELYKYAKSKGKSVGDLNTQLEYLVSDLKSKYSDIWGMMTTSTDNKEICELIVTKYIKPAQVEGYLANANNNTINIYNEYKGSRAKYADETTEKEYTEVELEDLYHDWVVETTIPEGVSKYKKYLVTDPIDLSKLDFSGLDRVLVERVDATGKVLEVLTKDKDYKAEYDEKTGVLTITYINEKDGNNFHGDFLTESGVKSRPGIESTKIRVTFNTTFKVNENGKLAVLDGAVTNAENKSKLTYDNGSGKEEEKDSETPEVHTGAVSIFKYEDTNGNKKHDEGEKALVGAEFKIALTEEDAKNGKFIKIDGKELTAVSNEHGIATFVGLSFGGDAKDDEKNLKDGLYNYDWEKASRDYYIVETKTPAAYEKMEDIIKVTVSKNSSEIVDIADKISDMVSVGNRPLKFDLALRKWVTQAYVTEKGQTKVYETGHKAEDNPEDVVKVDLKKSRINEVTVKFKYSIRIKNEGEIAGEAREITDYIPKGLKFVQEDNPEWKTTNDERVVKTRKLEGVVLEPGETAEVEIVLTWVNSESSMGVMTNTAEISEDYNEFGVHDIDSTPNNKKPKEDDIDDAPVMLTIKTGSEVIGYVTLALSFVAIILEGIIMIRKSFINI